MQISKSKRSVVAGKKLVKQQSIQATVESQKAVKATIDKLGSLMAACSTPEEKKSIQGAIANLSVVLLELKK